MIEWVTVPGLATMSQIVCRASNRVFVGLPMCAYTPHILCSIAHKLDYLIGKDPEYLKLVVNFPREVGKGRFVLGLVPTILKP